MAWLLLSLSLVVQAALAVRGDRLVQYDCLVPETGAELILTLDLSKAWASLLLTNRLIVMGPYIVGEGQRIAHLNHNMVQLVLYENGRGLLLLRDGTKYNTICTEVGDKGVRL